MPWSFGRAVRPQHPLGDGRVSRELDGVVVRSDPADALDRAPWLPPWRGGQGAAPQSPHPAPQARNSARGGRGRGAAVVVVAPAFCQLGVEKAPAVGAGRVLATFGETYPGRRDGRRRPHPRTPVRNSIDEMWPSPTARRLITKRVSPARQAALVGVGDDGRVEQGGAFERDFTSEIGADEQRPCRRRRRRRPRGAGRRYGSALTTWRRGGGGGGRSAV